MRFLSSIPTILAVLILFAGFSAPGSAAERMELVRASEAEYITIEESEEGVMILKGGILLKMGERTIMAETIKVNPRTGEIFGEGGVTLKDGLQTVTGERFFFDNKNDRGILYNASVNFENKYFWGGEFKQVDRETVIVRDAFFTSCVAKKPHYGFSVSKLWIYSDDQMLALNVFYEVGGVPVFYLPAIFQNEMSTGIITQYGNNPSKGHFFQNTYYFGVTSNTDSFLVPQKGKLMFDWYQRGGEYLGTQLSKNSPNLTYELDLGVARYRQLQAVNDPDGDLTFTNLVGTLGNQQEQNELWWKIRADITANWNRSHEFDSRSSLTLRFKHYRHPNFETEFGARFEPQNFFESVSRFRFFQSAQWDPLLNWEATYTEDWQDNHFSMQIIRQLSWYQRTDNAASAYIPVYALMPSIRFEKRKALFDPAGSFFGGGWGELSLNGSVARNYNNGEEIRTVFSGDAIGSLNFFLNFSRFVNLVPVMGYGVRDQFARQSDATLITETDRNSYQFLFTRQTLTVGPSQFFARSIYHFEYGIQQGFVDPTFGAQRGHSIDLSLNSDFNPYFTANVSSRRDLRQLPYELPESWRWTPLVFNMNAEYDFVHGFASGYYGMNQRSYRHFIGVGMTENYTYLWQFARSGHNDINTYFQMGGYRLAILRELSHFRMGVNWHHNFINARDSQMRLNWELNLLLHPYWRLITGGASRAEQMERYNTDDPRHVNFFEDLARSVNPFDPTDRSGRVFNIENFYAHLEHNLHRWLFRLSYSVGARTVFYGPQLRNRISFFEQTFYLSFTLQDLGGFGIPRTEVFRDSPIDAGI